MELKGYFRILQKKWWLIVAIALIAGVGAGVKSIFFTQPIYEASSKLIVNQTSNVEGRAMMDFSMIQSNIKLINSYKEIIKSSAIMEKVATTYPDLKVTTAELISRTSVTTASESQVMNITVQGTTYENAAKTVNAISKVFQSQIPLIMKIDNVAILSEANINGNAAPINMKTTLTIIVSLFAGLVLAIALVFLMDYLDDTFKLESEIEKELGIPVLTVISKMKKDDVKGSKNVVSQQKVGDGKYVTVNQ
ncbi:MULTISPECIES: YveK family protein [Paenibacillus]|uniref:YveK family protein n=1 Tax=Paenibacillus TaxID=44249 RepID=UPI000FE24BDD|nr:MULTISPECIES: Wzz/FepE/Etk N-terminal domain-containing protein [Paenibacillus]MCM3174494.1 Wzz/FepE/Etk N-terminal domain-containing protein [Paenibacillus sp. MER 99-2]